MKEPSEASGSTTYLDEIQYAQLALRLIYQEDKVQSRVVSIDDSKDFILLCNTILHIHAILSSRIAILFVVRIDVQVSIDLPILSFTTPAPSASLSSSKFVNRDVDKIADRVGSFTDELKDVLDEREPDRGRIGGVEPGELEVGDGIGGGGGIRISRRYIRLNSRVMQCTRGLPAWFLMTRISRGISTSVTFPADDVMDGVGLQLERERQQSIKRS